MAFTASYQRLAGIFFARATFGLTNNRMRKLTQVVKRPNYRFFGIPASIWAPIESGRFTGFSGNAQFGNPVILRGFHGSGPGSGRRRRWQSGIPFLRQSPEQKKRDGPENPAGSGLIFFGAWMGILWGEPEHVFPVIG